MVVKAKLIKLLTRVNQIKIYILKHILQKVKVTIYARYANKIQDTQHLIELDSNKVKYYTFIFIFRFYNQILTVESIVQFWISFNWIRFRSNARSNENY